MGSGMPLSSAHLLETNVFFFPSHPALVLGLSGTVWLILSTGNRIKQKKPHQYWNLLAQLQNKPFLPISRLLKKDELFLKVTTSLQFLLISAVFVGAQQFCSACCPYMHGLDHAQLHNETSFRENKSPNPTLTFISSFKCRWWKAWINYWRSCRTPKSMSGLICFRTIRCSTTHGEWHWSGQLLGS